MFEYRIMFENKLKKKGYNFFNYFSLHMNKKSLCFEHKASPILNECQPAQLHWSAENEHEVLAQIDIKHQKIW